MCDCVECRFHFNLRCLPSGNAIFSLVGTNDGRFLTVLYECVAMNDICLSGLVVILIIFLMNAHYFYS